MTLSKNTKRYYNTKKKESIFHNETQYYACLKCTSKFTQLITMAEITAKMLIELDAPQFYDCIRSDKKCYERARELERDGLLSKNKLKLLAHQKRKHMTVKMFGRQWWKK